MTTRPNLKLYQHANKPKRIIMKFLSILLCFCFTTNVLASTTPSRALEDIIDTYIYSTTVEWDQLDATYKNEKELELMNNLLVLQAEGNLTPAQILATLERKINNPEVVEALKLKASTLDGSQGPQELLNLLQSQQVDLYSQGASWNGTAVAFYGGIALIFIAFVSYSTWYNANYECSEWVSESRHNTCASWVKKD